MYAVFPLTCKDSEDWIDKQKIQIIIIEIQIENNIQTFNYWLCPFFNELTPQKKIQTQAKL